MTFVTFYFHTAETFLGLELTQGNFDAVWKRIASQKNKCATSFNYANKNDNCSLQSFYLSSHCV